MSAIGGLVFLEKSYGHRGDSFWKNVTPAQGRRSRRHQCGPRGSFACDIVQSLAHAQHETIVSNRDIIKSLAHT